MARPRARTRRGAPGGGGGGRGWVFSERAGRTGSATPTGWVFARAPPAPPEGAPGPPWRPEPEARLLGGPRWWARAGAAGALGCPPPTALALWGGGLPRGAECELGLVPWSAAGAGGAVRAAGGGEEPGGEQNQRGPSRRRTLGVAFTCEACGERTTRLVNPRAYVLGTVFVECGGCGVKHLLVDHHELFGADALESPFPPDAHLGGQLLHPRNVAQGGTMAPDGPRGADPAAPSGD